MEANPYNNELSKLVEKLEPTDNKIEILKFTNEEDKYILHFSINNYPIKMITDFEVFCYFDSEIMSLENLNLEFINSSKKNPVLIISIIKKFKLNESNYKVEKKVLNDKYHLHQKIDNRTKFPINFSILEKESKAFRDSKIITDLSKFPKELLFNANQIYQIIANEIKNINQNMDYKHIVSPINNNPYDISVQLKLENPVIERIKQALGYDYIELKLSVDPRVYPFLPPKLEFIKPAIKLPLVQNLMNLKILKMENWNPTISLEWLLLNLSTKLEPIIQDYVKLEESKFNELEMLLVKLTSITKEKSIDSQIFEIEFNKIVVENTTTNKSANKYWKSGTGYGHDNGGSNWDISLFVKEQELQNIELTNLLKSINNKIDSVDSFEFINDSILFTFLINRINGLTLLEIDKCKPLYIEILNILEKLSTLKISEFKIQDFINKISDAFTNISDDISSLFQSNTEAQEEEIYIKIHCISDWYKSNSKKEEPVRKTIVIDMDDRIKKEYEENMKKLQFGTINEILSNHKFYDQITKKSDSKATMRMISEISSFKTGLPLNWDTTIWVRISKKYLNVFNFYISGPKDTPYENGIFEFHACFPSDYPNSEPKVLLNTTGGGSVRFNPNLYHCGKVCLSLLGTWNGQESEKWNPKNSTFLQVLVSIQSLILVELPCFNEPGWERYMNTKEGKQKSDTYNEPLLIGTIKWAINDMIKNPPVGMEEVIKLHFKMKKDDLISTTQKWCDISSGKTKEIIVELRKEMIELLNTL
jgi:ubiquitin-protein ligase